MADHKEYEIRSRELETNPFLKNYKEGYWQSPNKSVTIFTCVSYEAKMINLGPVGWKGHSSIYPVIWDMAFSEWTYLGRKLPDVKS